MGASREKLYQELGLKALSFQRWQRKLYLFNKAVKNKHPQYLFHLILARRSSLTSRNVRNIPIFDVKHFSKTFSFTIKNTVSPNYPVWDYCGKAQFRGNCIFPLNIHPRELGEFTVFFAVFPSRISEWDKLNLGNGNSKNLSIFRKNILQFLRLDSNC